jgi:hypothetical protein
MLEHVLHRQRVDTHHLIFADESGRQLVLKVSSAISNARVQFGNATARFLSILGAIGLARVPPLQVSQPLCQHQFVIERNHRRKF